MFPPHLVVHKAEAEVPVLMIAELIIKNVTAPIITNGVILKRNVFVRLLSNIHVQARVMPEEMEQLVTVNIQNANVQADMFGMPQPVHVFVQVLTNIHNGKYSQCKCASGYVWNTSQGACVCNGLDWCSLNQNCTSLGYAKQSCSGSAIKCPFDTSYVYCFNE